jgi:hypothetical protein
MRATRYGVRPRPGPPHPGRAVALLSLAALAVVPALLPGSERFDFGARWAAAVGGVLLFLTLVLVLLALLSRPPKAEFGADCALTLGREGFECRCGEGPTIRVALEDIERFEGAARLTVRRRDGTALVLPATLARGDRTMSVPWTPSAAFGPGVPTASVAVFAGEQPVPILGHGRTLTRRGQKAFSPAIMRFEITMRWICPVPSKMS